MTVFYNKHVKHKYLLWAKHRDSILNPGDE